MLIAILCWLVVLAAFLYVWSHKSPTQEHGDDERLESIRGSLEHTRRVRAGVGS